MKNIRKNFLVCYILDYYGHKKLFNLHENILKLF